MSRVILGLGAAVVALLAAPSVARAQVPVVLVCQDGTTQPGSSRVACGDHGGMDWEATKIWSEMRAGKFATADTVVCTDGQARAAGRNACDAHGGVDSVSTLAAVKRRAAAYRFADRPDTISSQGANVADVPKTKADSLKWGHPVTRDPDVQNPQGYRGMERPAGLDSTVQDTAARDTTAWDTTARDTTARDTTARDTAARDTTARDTTARDTTARDTTAWDTTAWDTTAQDTAAAKQ